MKLRLDEPVKGAEIDPAALIATRFLARHIDVTRSTRALAHLAGAKRSARRGRGVEFDEVRQYAAGDDVRSIDWRVTARSFKSVLAAHAASTLLWSALERGERIGAMTYAGTETFDVRPQRSRRSVLRFIGDIESATAHAADANSDMSFAEHLNQLQRIMRPGSSVFLISDFHDALAPDAIENLRRLIRHVQVTAIAISDPLEQQLPSAGRYVVSDELGRSSLDTGNDNVRKQYEEEYQQQRNQLFKTLQSLRIPMIELSTATAPLTTLQRYFPGR